MKANGTAEVAARNLLNAALAAGSTANGLDVIYQELDEHCWSGRFEIVRAVYRLAAADVNAMPWSFSLAILTITGWATLKDKPNSEVRREFADVALVLVAALRAAVTTKKDQAYADRLVRGFEIVVS
jgi:hypothetical protein